MNTITLKVPEVLDTQLKSFSKKKGLSKSEIVRIALNEYFSKDGTRSSSSFLDSAEDLAGSIEASADLSVNKKYLEGYGR